MASTKFEFIHKLDFSASSVDLRVYVKGKGIPLQAWTAPEGPRRTSLPNFKKIGT